jgi:hypothetical protein
MDKKGSDETKGTGGTRRSSGRRGRAGRQGKRPRLIAVKLYQGMPDVKITENIEITEEDKLSAYLVVGDTLKEKLTDLTKPGPISLTLPSLDLERLINQSFGMIDASTGCISSPGGPSC